MNLAAVDLNLLVAFEALMLERHVTRAGRRIGLAQPSMSSALTRLRLLFDDPLFVRSAGGMQPTPRALALAQPVGAALGEVRRALAADAPFEPATTRHRFTIAVTDYGDLVVVPALVGLIRRTAPGVDLAVRPITDARDSLQKLERGELDALIGGHLSASPQTIRRQLFTERFACIRAAGARGRLDEQRYLASPHALFSSVGGDGTPGAVDAMLAERGLKRRVAVTLPHAVAVPFAVAGTDLVATMAERIARRFAQAAGVSLAALPFPLAPFAVDLIHARHAAAPAALAWLIDQIVAAAAGATAPATS
ncbi:LysR family transcriptional regulator [Phreatobacter sp. AB_2022a]|uniref:LysR family transcriptional regulator n=1 Tax=Phreatobacter sp. AB_2022a TaxID=3003134 RepID=UPI0022873E4E|nr:LysR family transcriptional regulator [Phreatobacter sp. AB_2022a]MCZ0738430.1 LysR substrate-binding domain-containing protein [Phreatobacter sp. AB_2022a]